MSKKLKVGDLVKIKSDHIVRTRKNGKYLYHIPVAGTIVEIQNEKATIMWLETNCPDINAISMKIYKEYGEYYLDSLVLYAPYLKRISKYLSSLQEK